MDHTGHEQRHQKLAEAVIDARQAKGWVERELAEHSMVSRATIRELEQGHPSYGHAAYERTTNAVEEALGWERGSMSAFIENGTPLTPADEPPAPATGAGESQP